MQCIMLDSEEEVSHPMGFRPEASLPIISFHSKTAYNISSPRREACVLLFCIKSDLFQDVGSKSPQGGRGTSRPEMFKWIQRPEE